MAKGLIDAALLGDRKALEALYEMNKKKVYSLAFYLTDQTTAENITIKAFRQAYESMEALKIKDEEQFKKIVTNKTVTLCKKNILNKNEKALELHKNVSEELILFINVLESIAEYDFYDLLNTLKADKKTLKIALENIKKENYIEKDVTPRVERGVNGVIVDIIVPLENKKKKKITMMASVIGVIAVLIIAIICIVTPWTQDYNKNHETSLNMDSTYYADIDIKDYGKMTVQLDQNNAPLTVENFIELANKDFYDGLTFHRIIEGFMMQGGDPNGDSTGDSGKDIIGEFKLNGYDNQISHTRGTISMARGEDYNSGSCQFFIVHEDSTSLDKQYAGFGRVIEGIEIVDKICKDAKPIDGNGMIAKDEQPIINSITIREE